MSIQPSVRPDAQRRGTLVHYSDEPLGDVASVEQTTCPIAISVRRWGLSR